MEIPIDKFIDEIRATGGQVYSTAQTKGSETSLNALKIDPLTNRQLTSHNDTIAFNTEINNTVRIIPEALFTGRNIRVFAGGLPSVNGYFTGRTMRTKKFGGKFEKNISALQQINHNPEKAPPLLIGPIEEFNYSHWMLEGLPKLEVYKAAFGTFPEIVHVCGKRMPFHEQSIKLANEITEIQYIKKFPTDISHLAFTTSIARSVSEISPTTFRFYKNIRNGLSSINPPSRIYISRRNAKYRKVLNEDEILPILDRHGFETILPESLTVEAQAKIFKNAEAIISPHGAGLTNLVFSDRPKVVFEIFSSGFKDHSVYAHITRHLNASYLAMFCRPQVIATKSDHDPEGWDGHRSFNIDPIAFEKSVKHIVSTYLN